MEKNMRLEVLVSTVNANPHKLIKKMNIQTDAIIINQCDCFGYEEIKNGNNIVKVYSFSERGVGLSRNNALMRATGDIVLFADDDEVFVDGYEKIIINEFLKNREADFIVFDINACGSKERNYKKITKSKQLFWYNCLKYGAVRFAVKLNCIRRKNINFSLLFGGGTKYGSGEDSIFIYDCIKKKMKIYQNSSIIAKVDMTSSSWFDGYNEKFYYDKGALFSALNSKFNLIYLLIVVLKNHKNDKKNKLLWKLEMSMKGFKEFKVSD